MKWRYLLASLLFANTAYAGTTSVTAYVNTDCANNGDGSSFNCSTKGSPGAYSTLANALAGEKVTRPNLVASDETLTILLEGAAADTSGPISVLDTDFTTDSDHWIKLQGAETETGKHPGVWSDANYRLSAAACSLAGVLTIGVNYLYVDSFQIENTGTADLGCNNGIALSLMNGSYVGVYANGMLIRDNPAGAHQTTDYGIYLTYLNGGRQVYIANNIVYGFQTGIFIGCGGGGDNLLVYNNTSYGNTAYGLRFWRGTLCSSGGSVFHMKNNLLQVNGTADYNRPSTGGSTPTQDFSSNVTSDTSSPNGASFQSRTASFVNAGSADFHLAKNDVAATDRCISLVADTAYAFAIDFEQSPRATKWDCGADERPDTFRMGLLGIEW